MNEYGKNSVWLAIALLAANTTVLAQADDRARYGRAEMNISCATDARTAFDRGLLQLHSFAWQLSRESFAQAVAQEPDCAMAHWGIAMSYYDGLHEHPSADEVDAAAEALAVARRAAKKTPRETAYIDAATELFRGYPAVARVARDRHYSEALAKIVDDYPDDDEAKIFYALSLLSLTRRGDDSRLTQASEILEPLFAKLPEHPGVAHYLIHVYDDAGNREPGVAAARRYAGIAPLMTHAQHMPSHIFAGLGMWNDSNASNEGALEADPRYYHALMYLVYGHLQLGQWSYAKRLVDELREFSISPQGGTREQRGLHSVNTWLLLETRDWTAAADVPVYYEAPLEVAETLYIRGLGAAHTGRLIDAREALRELKEMLSRLDQVNDSGIASRTQLVHIQALQVEASIAFAEEKHAEAVAMMREATAIEDGPGVQRAPPDSGTGLPAHEVLGDMLLELQRYAEAREHFELALERTPRRLHSMLGLARSAAGSGDIARAAKMYGELLALLADADAGMQVLAEAQDYLDAWRDQRAD